MPMQRRTMRLRPVAKNCPFCNEKKEPDYKDVAIITRFLTERGKILGKARTGLCSKHQKSLTREIKRARHVGMVPFIVRAG